MKKSDFFFDLPPELIAQRPASQRDHSRLLVLDRKQPQFVHRFFYDLPEFLRPGDLLVVNDSRVLPARLLGTREKGGAAELLLLRQLEGDRWECLGKPARRMPVGTRMYFGSGLLRAEVEEVGEEGMRTVRFSYDGIFLEILEQLGQMPLPPYIRERLEDPERYQTVYAHAPGSAAAPTAGLHFTPELLDVLRAKGVGVEAITLHVGLGTFRPVKADSVTDHVMHSEFCILPPKTAQAVNRTKEQGGRVIAVGTTACRTLESFAGDGVPLVPGSRWTDIFITPGYRFGCIDGLITNFHLPESTLVMLVSALAGHDRIMSAYREAIAQNYRFFSFGDAMLIL